MPRRDWLALVAVHADTWLLAVAFFYAVKLDAHGRWGERGIGAKVLAVPSRLAHPCCARAHAPCAPRARLFKMINAEATLFETVTDRKPSGTAGQPFKRQRPVRAPPAPCCASGSAAAGTQGSRACPCASVAHACAPASPFICLGRPASPHVRGRARRTGLWSQPSHRASS